METQSETAVAGNRKDEPELLPPLAAIEPKDGNPGENGFSILPREIRVYIIKLLPQQDLFNCRLVSQQFKADVHSVLESQRVFAVVKNPCRDFMKLFLDLQKYQFDIINGLKIDRISPKKCCIESDCGPPIFSSISQPLGTALPWKYIYVEGDWDESCPAEKMIVEIVSYAQDTLQDLDLQWAPSICQAFNNSLRRSSKKVAFPKLQRISLSRFDSNEKVYRILCRAAPNLREFDCELAYTWNLGEDYQDLAKKISYISYYTPKQDQHLKKFVHAVPRALKNLQLEQGVCENVDTKKLVVELMRLNRTSLEELRWWCLYQVAAMIDSLGPGLNCFPKLKDLSLEVPEEAWALKALLQKLNIGRSFPALKKVVVSFFSFPCPHEMREENIESGEGKNQDGFAPGFVPSSASCIYYSDFHPDQIQKLKIFGQAFPNVTKMEIEWFLEETLDLGQSFAAFPNLENLKLDFSADAPFPGKVDAALCGLSFEEAELLQQQSEGKSLDLEKLVIVPIRPALSYLKRLKKLKIEITGMARGNGNNDNSVGLSEVSGILAFSRMHPQKPEKIKVVARLRNFADVTRVRPYISQVKFEEME